MQYVCLPSESASCDVESAVLRDDGSVAYEADGVRQESPKIPGGGKQLAIECKGLWCLSNAGKVYFWQPSMKAWQREKQFRRPTSVNCLADGSICIGTASGEALVQVDGKWADSIEAGRWLDIQKRPSRIRFGLRSLMLVFLGAAICLGPITAVMRAKQRHRTLRMLKDQGNRYSYAHHHEDVELHPPWYTMIVGKEICYELESLTIDEELPDLNVAWVKDVSSVGFLDLSDIASLDGIEQFRELNSLRLPNGAEEVSALRNAPWIRDLSLIHI